MGLSVGGAEIRTERCFISTGEELAILLSGSGVNFLLFAVFVWFCKDFAFINLLLGVFNLLPSCGLDGAGVARCLLERLFLPEVSYKIMSVVSFLTLFFIWFWALFLIIFSDGGNISLFMVFWALFNVNLKTME